VSVLSGDSQTRVAWTVLAIAMAACVALIMVEARNTAMQGDEWSYVYRLASQPLLPAVFDSPYGGYLIAPPMLIYAGLLEVFGMASYLPYRIVGLVLLLAAALLVFELARRRVGPLAALLPAVLLLFLGSGSEVVVVPNRLPSQVALTAGLGMLIALERRDLRGDVIACVLLIVALTSHPLGLAFGAAAITSLCLRPAGERLNRWWVVVPGLLLFAAWWVTLHGSFPESESPSIGEVASFVANSFVAACAAATGFFRAPWSDGADFINGFSIALAVAIAGAIAIRLATLRPVPATAWVALAALVVALVAPGFAPGGFLDSFRQPDAPRYLYPNVVLLYLVGAELAAGIRLRRSVKLAAMAGVVSIFAVSLVSNFRLLIDRANQYEQGASLLKAKLAGAELAHSRSTPVIPAGTSGDDAGFQLLFTLGSPSALPPTALAAYYQVSDKYGSPAYTSMELQEAPEDLQDVAAIQFRRALEADQQPRG
jgi:hypothetical protein